MRILPNIGLDDVRFGMTRNQVQDLLGVPEQQSIDGDGEDASEAWYYWSQGISMHFHADLGWRLGTIEINCPEAMLCGQRPVGMQRRELRTLLAGLTVDWSGDEFEPIRVKEWEMDIYFEDGLLSHVQWSVPIGDDDIERFP
jgi:hypothetical protein